LHSLAVGPGILKRSLDRPSPAMPFHAKQIKQFPNSWNDLLRCNESGRTQQSACSSRNWNEFSASEGGNNHGAVAANHQYRHDDDEHDARAGPKSVSPLRSRLAATLAS
jgi:hypothetical protein